MSDTPLISVIVPVYNVEKYIKECVESIRKQTLTNIEIILVDDESPDYCPEICDQYAELDSRIQVIHKKNEGLGFARNSGLDIAKGTYVCFVDSDDYISYNRLEEMYHLIHKYDADMCLTGYSTDNQGTVSAHRNPYANRVFCGEEIYSVLLPSIVGRDSSGMQYVEMSACFGLYRREIIVKNHIRFCSERQWASEDLFFNCEYYKYVHKAVMSELVGYYYRVNENSLTHTFSMDKFQRYDDLYLEFLNRIDGFPYQDELKKRGQFTYIFNYKAVLQGLVCRNLVKNPVIVCRKITYRKMICDVFAEYSVKKLPFRKKIFCLAMKYHCGLAIYLMLKVTGA